VLLLGLAISAATGWLVASSLSWMAWSIVLSALLILAGDSFLSLRDVSSTSSVRGRAGAAWGRGWRPSRSFGPLLPARPAMLHANLPQPPPPPIPQTQHATPHPLKGIWWSRASTAAAGMTLSAIFALGLAFLLGWRQRRAAPGGGGGGPIKY
jgi:hypothetical protein